MSMKIHKHGVHDTYIYLSNFYAFSRAYLSSSLLFMKTIFMSSATEKQHATKSIDAKRKFMMRKPLYFLLISACR